MASIKHLFHIAAPREKVYEAISTLEGFQNWWTVQTTGSDTTGGVLAFRFNGVGPDFKVVAFKPNESFSLECVAGFADWIGTTLEFRLDENEGKTRVRFTHDGWKETGDNYAACCFSWSRYLESLRQLCQEGVGKPFGSATYA